MSTARTTLAFAVYCAGRYVGRADVPTAQEAIQQVALERPDLPRERFQAQSIEEPDPPDSKTLRERYASLRRALHGARPTSASEAPGASTPALTSSRGGSR